MENKIQSTKMAIQKGEVWVRMAFSSQVLLNKKELWLKIVLQRTRGTMEDYEGEKREAD